MSAPLGTVEFGGPDLPPRRLRDLLQQHVEQAPPGSRIDWATYYFRDRALASALIRASDRGVNVRLALDPEPRRAGSNDTVIAMLQRHGLGGGLHLYRPEHKGGHLHAKVYAFSEPDVAWIGSFNPSGDDPDDAEVIAEIGDQDRGHNLLVGITRPKLTSELRRFVGRISDRGRMPYPLRLEAYQPVVDGNSWLYFYPRIVRAIAEPSIRKLGRGDRVNGAVSHMKTGPFTTALIAAARRGAEVDLLVHDTERRVPSDLVDRLQGAGASITRVRDPDGLPMHAKFLLVRDCGLRFAWLGSYNFNNRSRRRNSEVLLRTGDGALIDALEQRFAAIEALAAAEPAWDRLANPARIP